MLKQLGKGYSIYDGLRVDQKNGAGDIQNNWLQGVTPKIKMNQLFESGTVYCKIKVWHVF